MPVKAYGHPRDRKMKRKPGGAGDEKTRGRGHKRLRVKKKILRGGGGENDRCRKERNLETGHLKKKRPSPSKKAPQVGKKGLGGKRPLSEGGRRSLE